MGAFRLATRFRNRFDKRPQVLEESFPPKSRNRVADRLRGDFWEYDQPRLSVVRPAHLNVVLEGLLEAYRVCKVQLVARAILQGEYHVTEVALEACLELNLSIVPVRKRNGIA